MSKRLALTTIGPRKSAHASMLYGVSEEDISKYCGASTKCSKNTKDILGTVPAGVTLTVRRITNRKGWSIWYGSFNDDMRVYASTDPAQLTEKNIFDITDLSVARQEAKDKIFYIPDRLLLNRKN